MMNLSACDLLQWTAWKRAAVYDNVEQWDGSGADNRRCSVDELPGSHPVVAARDRFRYAISMEPCGVHAGHHFGSQVS